MTQSPVNTVNLDFTLTRTGDTGYDVVVPYATADDTAQAGTDYTATSGSATIAAGATTATVSVPVLAGSNAADKSFFLNLAGAVGIGPAPGFQAETDDLVGADGRALPHAIAAGDFDGDGKTDLVVVNYDNTLCIMLNTTAPGAASATYNIVAGPVVGGQPADVAVADFNGDGLPDLAVTSPNAQTHSVVILFNTTVPGAGTVSFGSPGAVTLGTSASSPSAIAAGDFNGDGRPDLAVVTSGDGTVSILFNATAPGAATASFNLAASPLVGDFANAVAVGDFDGDGRPDLAVVNRNDGTISILRNGTAPGAASGSFTAATVAVGSLPDAAAVGDFNGDGRPDLAVANSGDSTVSILLNTSTPGIASISFNSTTSPPVGNNPVAIVVSDFNGDGKPDLATTSNADNTVSILVNTTVPGAFSAGFYAAADLGLSTRSPSDMVAVDLNGDGKPDLAVVLSDVFARTHTVATLLNATPAPIAAAPSFAAQQPLTTGSGPLSVAAADVNGDGLRDLLVVNLNSATVSVLLNTTAPGAAAPSFAPQQSFATGSGPVFIAAADVNGDGLPDLLVANQSSTTVSVLLNTTAPGAAAPSFAPQTFATGSLPISVVAADVNGDGLPDLLVANNGSNTVSVLLNTTLPSATTLSFAPQQTFAAGIGPRSVAAADVNGDGLPDLLVANNSSSTVSVLRNTTAVGATAPSFAAQQTFAAGIGPRSVAAADINGDGRPDLLVANGNSSTVSVLLNTTLPGATPPSFATQQSFATGTNPFSVAAADVNGDGRPDLLVANGNSSTVSVLLNTTAAGDLIPSFAAQQTFATGSFPRSVAAADLNGDGLPDLLVANQNSNTVSVLLNTQYQSGLSNTSAVGTITTAAADATPDAFVFTDVTKPAGTSTVSNSITVGGITAAVPLVLSGPSSAAPQYSINGGKFKYYNTAGGGPKVNNGDTVRLRAISSQSAGTVDLVLSLGSVSDTWTLTTSAQSSTPNAFDFKDKTNQPANRYIASGGVRIAGINAPVAISISGDPSASFRINNGGYIAGPAMVSRGDLVVLRLKSAATPGASVNAIVNIGGVMDSWTVTTAP